MIKFDCKTISAVFLLQSRSELSAKFNLKLQFIVIIFIGVILSRENTSCFVMLELILISLV